MAEPDPQTGGPRATAAGRVLPAALMAAGTGALIAFQGRVNGDLTSAGAGPLMAGWVSYLGTLVTIALVVVLRGRASATARTLRERSLWWWYAIGLCGVPIVLASAYGVPVLGVAVASVASVAGQTVAGLALDARGVGVPGRLPLTRRRALAAAVAVAGLVWAVLGGSGTAAAGVGHAVLVGVALFAAGAILSVQNAGNGAVTRDSGDPMIAGLASAVGGSAAISALLVGVLVSGGGPADGLVLPPAAGWTLYLGGPLGAAIVVSAAWAVRHLGTFALTLTVIAGQLVAAMAVDLVRGLGAPWPTLAAVVAIVLATALGVTRPVPRAAPAPPVAPRG